MIYEYPKEFIVPVFYVEDLAQKRNESIREWNLFGMGENIQNNEINDENIGSMGENQDVNFPYMSQGLLINQYKEPIYSYDMSQEISDNDNVKSILNDIDEDYAASETLSM